MADLAWFSPVSQLKGVGTAITEKLKKMNIQRVGDFLLHCPTRYEDRTRLTALRDLRPLQLAVIQGKISQCAVYPGKKKRIVLSLIDQVEVDLVFFNYYPPQLKLFQDLCEKEAVLRCFGQVKMGQFRLQMVQPEYEIIDQHAPADLPQSLTPIYPTVAGISQAWLRKMIQGILTNPLFRAQSDFLLPLLPTPDRFFDWQQALGVIHHPPKAENIEALIARKHPAYQRLIVDELIAQQLSLKLLKENEADREALPLTVPPALLSQFLNNLAFSLTPDQARVWGELQADLARTQPTLRLVQGDVGCGKTVVAALCALAAVSHEQQVAVMAPTEILAQQLHSQFERWFRPLGFRCELLSGKLKAKPRRSIQENLLLGLSAIIIGTHALFQESVQFKNLALVIIDEQHRFGVHQRLSLQNKGSTGLESCVPHQVTLTATPIPRTLMMSHYAHLDISVIAGLPPGRQGITTLAMSQARREEIIARIGGVCDKGQQVYWLCTLIEESEILSAQAAEVTAEQLQALLPQYRIGLIHGRLSGLEKESVMEAFYAHEMDILVATTVIEVGVNVPNATLMIIENPERLGLAQLHQLRGRVGRGSEASFCILLYQPPLSQAAKARLQILRDTQDGFVIAETDLALRGPGEVLGLKQTGAVNFKIADVMRDKEIIEQLCEVGETISLQLDQRALNTLIDRWGIGREYGQA